MISFRAVTGTRLDLENPTPEMIEFDAIAQGLSNCCRFAGQIYNFYSVAQHSVLVAGLVQPRLRLAALMHDATEAYLGDLSRYLKHSIYLDGYCVLERKLDAAIQQKCGYLTSRDDLEQIKVADNLAAVFEHIVLRTLEVWNAERAIRWACSEGFITASPEPLLLLASRLPRWQDFTPLPPQAARLLFEDTWKNLAL